MAFKHNMVKGDKVILITKCDDKNGIHVSTVVEVGKNSARLDCGNTVRPYNYEYLEQHKDNLIFFKPWACDRKKVTCEIRGTQSYPISASVFNQNRYDTLKQMILDQIKKENAESMRISKKEEVTKNFNDFREVEESKLFCSLRDKYVETVCKNCSHYTKEGTCSRDNSFYNVGILSKTNHNFFSSSAGSMCHWDSK